MKIGIPQGLFFYQFYPFWKTFFENLDCEVVLSTTTNNNVLKKGLDLAVDDACLPVKLYHGHVADLIGKADTIFIPRITSIEPKAYICPKFLGLPDMIKSSISNMPKIIDVDLNLYKGKVGLYDHIFKIGQILGKSKGRTFYAYIKGIKALKTYNALMIKNQLTPMDIIKANKNTKINTVNDKPKVLLLGHHYNIYDAFISMNIIDKLRKQNIDIITCEMVTNQNILKGAQNLSKDLFWTLGKKILGTAYYYLDRQKIDGIIHIASFGCGPDSLIGELLEQRVRYAYKTPFLCLYLDEHAAEAGFNTRLEAFLDVLEGRKLYEKSNLSTHG